MNGQSLGVSTDVVRYGHPVRQSSQGVLASMSTDLTSKNNREFIDHGPKCTNHQPDPPYALHNAVLTATL